MQHIPINQARLVFGYGEDIVAGDSQQGNNLVRYVLVSAKSERHPHTSEYS